MHCNHPRVYVPIEYIRYYRLYKAVKGINIYLFISDVPMIYKANGVSTLNSFAITTFPNSLMSPLLSSSPPFSSLINPKHTTRQNKQLDQIPERKRLRLKYSLQKRQINHHQLTDQRSRNSEIKHLVRKDRNSRCIREGETWMTKRSTRQCIKHIKKHKRCECLH